MYIVRAAAMRDLPTMRIIYNQGIEDRVAALETEPMDLATMAHWLIDREARYGVMVAEMTGMIVGWASINRYIPRSAYEGVGELIVYVERDHRGRGIGERLLKCLESYAKRHGFYKFVLFALPTNTIGQSLYRKLGYHEVGVFRDQGVLDGRFVDVMAMEKILRDYP